MHLYIDASPAKKQRGIVRLCFDFECRIIGLLSTPSWWPKLSLHMKNLASYEDLVEHEEMKFPLEIKVENWDGSVSILGINDPDI